MALPTVSTLRPPLPVFRRFIFFLGGSVVVISHPFPTSNVLDRRKNKKIAATKNPESKRREKQKQIAQKRTNEIDSHRENEKIAANTP